MSLHPANYEEALARKQASDARKRSQPRTSLKRTKMVVRRVSKKATSDGDSERNIRDNCDQIVRDILVRRDDYYCIVCGASGNSVELHPGHFITRKVLALRWDLRNVWPQCNECNQEHNEDATWYRSMLSMEIGNLAVEELERIGRENPHIDYVDLLAIRDGLRLEIERTKK